MKVKIIVFLKLQVRGKKWDARKPKIRNSEAKKHKMAVWNTRIRNQIEKET